jgi:2'-5' RNA ligase
MYSLTVPVPGRVAALASDIARELPAAHARSRGEHSLCVKRLDGTGTNGGYSRLEARSREMLAEQGSFEVSVTGVDCFERPAVGSGPVVYLVVESPELRRLHERLAVVFPPIEGVEGPEYTPHVTVSRGGSRRGVERVTDRTVEPITWTVSELVFWDATSHRSVSTVSLD